MPYWPLMNSFYDLLIPFVIYLGIARPARESLPFIIFLGFIMDNIYIKDHDFSNPDFDNDTWNGRLKNRRVDIVLWPLPS